MWNDQVNITVISFSLNHVLCSCSDGVGGADWFLSGVYGFPEEFNKWKTWKLISQLSTQIESNWICIGDLNDILSSNEKLGGIARSQSQMGIGRQCVEECGLIDLGFEGYPYTWSNGRQDEENIQCRLDRALCTSDFQNRFSPIRVVHLHRYGSDHAALMILLENHDYLQKKKRVKMFRFEQVWTQDPRCDDEVRQAWCGGAALCETKLRSMSRLDKVFEDYQIGNVRKEIKDIEEDLKEFNAWAASPEEITRYKEKERRHDELLHTEEVIWRQRSRAVWLKEGDRNTKFFHGKASQRKKVNHIKKLKDSHGVWWHGEENVERLLIDHFSEILSTSDPENIDSICNVVRGKLNSDHIESCSAQFTEEEIKEVIQQMHPLKAPGPDGLPALFFQKFWHIVGRDVQNLVLEILNNNRSPEDINNTFIALIPKIKNPVTPKDYRPISLCNVVMKIVTKVIANRIKPLLPDIIDEEQSAFVQGRLITDNALIAMECFHWMKKKKKGKKGTMALKLDMSKAYDRIEWPFVRATLTSMGFPGSMVDLILRCISTVSYKILINGQPSKNFTPERGLRQGDPLSPYLFILCADVLSGLVKNKVGIGSIHGIQIARQAPKISHLLFADDSLLFARANSTEADAILSVLAEYQKASGQVVNMDKSEVSFSQNVRNVDKDMICNRMGVKTVDTHSKYLGLPVVFGRSKKLIFSLVIDRIWKKLKGWKESCLSRAGKEILIKAVAQAIPNYIMGYYKLPESCCQEIESMLAKFWWGSTDGKRKIHWMSWERLSKPKKNGGMGFRGLSDFNKALLGKHCWRLLMGEDSLMGRVFKSRYYPRTSFLEAKIGYQPSYAWRSMQSAKDVIDLGARWRIGNGEKVRIIVDKWMPNHAGFKVWSRCEDLNDDTLVCDLIDPDTKQWKRDLVSHLFHPHEALQILSMPISPRLPPDKLVWHFERDGDYSVRSAHHLVKQHHSRNLAESSGHQTSRLWTEIWKATVPNRVKNFLWRLAKNILPTRDNLSKKGVQIENLCPLCNAEPETVDHIFLHCQIARLTWFASQIGVHVPQNMPLNQWLLQGLNCEETMGAKLFCVLLWKMWGARNNLIFNNKPVNPIDIAQDAMSFVQELLPHNHDRNSISLLDDLVSEHSLPSAPNTFYVDASCFSGTATGWGMAVYNHVGLVVFSACKKEPIVVEPVLAEAMGVLWCLQQAIAANMSDIVIISDAATVVNCINTNSVVAVIDLVIQDCKLLIEQLDRVVVTHVRRHLNHVAHGLAGFSRNVGTKMWMGVVPNSLSAALCNSAMFTTVSS
jgi:ribonuclease HI